MPELFETIALNGDGLANAPFPDVPYFLHTVEGDFLYRNTEIGTVLLKENTRPKTLGKVGYTTGVFDWSGEKIPARLISQAHDFFRRIYEKHHTESEVLITKNYETNEYRLFVPYQRVSHTGVKSIHEPTHIARTHTVVGTLHSHCDFGAFHSSTDSGDASDMDGVHFTIGHVNAETPEIVAMVVMNGSEFHYKDPTLIAEVEFGTHTAPEWWDTYVYPGQAPAEKPRSFRSITESEWNQFRGVELYKPKKTPTPVKALTPYVPSKRGAGWVSPYAPTGRWVPPPNASKKYDDWDDYRYKPSKADKPFVSKMTGNPEQDAINKALDIAEFAGVFHDSEWKDIKAADVDEPEFWKLHFMKKMDALTQAMAELGTNILFITDTETSK